MEPQDLVGEVIGGQFRVDRFVGEGVLSVVYRGRHVDLGLGVAIKCLHLPSNLDPALAWPIVENFLEGCRLHHQLARGNLNIAQTIASGTAAVPKTGAALQYYVREWLEGESLAQDLLRRRSGHLGGRSLEEALALLDGAADGLAFAHRRGVAHLALRPANVFLIEGDEGACSKVLDFGIGRAVDVAEVGVLGSTAVQSLWAAYASPEQLRRQPGGDGPPADVYGFAVLLLEVLSGKPMFEVGDAGRSRISDTLRQPSLSEHGVRVPESVARVLRRALAVDPSRRYPEMASFWSEFRVAVRAATLFRLTSAVARPVRRVLSTPPRAWNRKTSDLAATMENTPLAPAVSTAAPSGRSLLPELFPADEGEAWADQTAKWDVLAVIERAASLGEAWGPRAGGVAAMRVRRSKRPPALGLRARRSSVAKSTAKSVARSPKLEPAPTAALTPPPPPISVLADTTNRMPIVRDLAALVSADPPHRFASSRPPPSLAVAPVVPSASSPLSPVSSPPVSPLSPVSSPPSGASSPPSGASSPTSGASSPTSPPTSPSPRVGLPRYVLAFSLAAVVAAGALATVLLVVVRPTHSQGVPTVVSTVVAIEPRLVPLEPTASSADVAPRPTASSADAAPLAPVGKPPLFRLGRAIKALDQVADLSSCRTADGLWGSGDAVVEFGVNGRPSQVLLGTPYRGVPTGACVSAKLESADMGPFEGTPQRVIYRFKVPSAVPR